MKHEQVLKKLLERALPELKEHCWHMKLYRPVVETNKNLPRNEQLVREIEEVLKGQLKQGTLTGLDPTHPSVEASMEAIWEVFCSWHLVNWGWTPTKDQRDIPQTHVWSNWMAYQAGVTLGLEAQTAPAPAPVPAPVRAYDPIWAKFVLYYESFGRGTPEREDLDNPLMDVQEHYNLFKAEYHTKRETLRDEFAGQAMQGLLSRYPVGCPIDKPDIAYQSYRMAQEMMRMRDKQIRNP